MDEETIMYLGSCLMVTFLAIYFSTADGPLAGVVILLSVVAMVLIAVINYADYLVFPLITSLLNTSIIPALDYYIPKKQNCVMKSVNGIYYATGYLTANIYNYVFKEEKNLEDDSHLAGGTGVWERIVMNSKFPFKFHMIASAEEIQKYRDDIEGRRGAAEFQLSREMQATNPHQTVIDELQAKINIAQALMDRLSGGERPLDLIMYVETTAYGVSEKAAADMLDAQVSQLQTMLVGFDLSVSRVVGRELYILFGFTHRLPTTIDEMAGVFNKQG